FLFFFSSRRRHTRFSRDWSSDVCSSDLNGAGPPLRTAAANHTFEMEMRDDAPVCELPRFAENLCERFRISRSAASNSNFCAGPQHEPNIKRGRQLVATLSWRIRSARVLKSQVRGSEDCISAPA